MLSEFLKIGAHQVLILAMEAKIATCSLTSSKVFSLKMGSESVRKLLDVSYIMFDYSSPNSCNYVTDRT